MIPYTTPLFQIHIEGDGSNKLADCDHIWANFRQGDLLLQKKEGVTFNADTGYAYVRLTQEESGQFREGVMYIQLHAMQKDGNVWKSHVYPEQVERTLTEEVIT